MIVFLSCHIRIWSDSILCKCLNIKERIARNKCNILDLRDCNGIGTHNHLVCKQTLNLLAKLTFLPKWFTIGLRTKWLWVRVPLQLLIRDFLSFLKKAL